MLQQDNKEGYALLYLCEEGTGIMMLMARTRRNLPDHVREEVIDFLKKHGYNKKLLMSNNDDC